MALSTRMGRDALPSTSPELLAIERAVIGACLADTRGCRVWPTIRPEDFSTGGLADCWAAMLDLTERTEHPTVIDLAYELQRRDELDRAGGVGALALLLEEGCGLVDVGSHGGRIRQAATERRRAALGRELAQHPEGSATLTRILRSLEEQGHGDALGLGQVWLERQDRPPLDPLPTGLTALDHVIAGVPRGVVTVIGGRAAHGKTSLTCHVARRLASQVPVEFITLEEPRTEIFNRMLAGATGQSLWSVRYGGAVTAADVDAIADLPLTIREPAAVHEDVVVGAVGASPATVVVVDHLQQISTRGDDSRAYALERVMGRLAVAARRDDKAVIVTAQLNRQVEARQGEPTLADLRDSGGIEQVARQVWLLYWPAKHDAQADPRQYRVIIGKNNFGPTGRVLLDWDSRTGRFLSAHPHA